VGQSYYNRGDYIRALKNYKSAVDVIEGMLAGLYPDEIRFFFVIDKYDCYKKVVDCLLQLNRINDSFISSLKALETINRKTGLEVRLKAEVPEELIETRNELRAALKKLTRSPRGEYRGMGSISSYFNLEQKLWSNERKIREYLYPERAEGKPALVDYDIRKFLTNDETIVSFFSADKMAGAFCATNSSTEFVKFDISPEELDILLRKLHFVFEKAVFGLKDADKTRIIADHYLQIIYTSVFRPIIKNISGRSIILITDGRFSQIPVSALKDDNGNYLREKFDLKIVISPEDIRLKGVSSEDSLGRRNAIFAVSSDILPSIDAEAMQIKHLFRNSRLYINEKADCQNLNSELKEADGFIHIAAHASRSSENPLFSRILMGDGPFFPFDLFESGVKARLVTLSGCQTAAPGLNYGNSFSLAKAFYQAGSQHVLATLWPVSDKLSMLFMIEFYKTLADVGNVYDAYQNAVNETIQVTDNPAFWSSFVLLGI
jgi:hypothetical protein